MAPFSKTAPPLETPAPAPERQPGAAGAGGAPASAGPGNGTGSGPSVPAPPPRTSSLEAKGSALPTGPAPPYPRGSAGRPRFSVPAPGRCRSPWGPMAARGWRPAAAAAAIAAGRPGGGGPGRGPGPGSEPVPEPVAPATAALYVHVSGEPRVCTRGGWGTGTPSLHAWGCTGTPGLHTWELGPPGLHMCGGSG